jgi:hypothetical protein
MPTRYPSYDKDPMNTYGGMGDVAGHSQPWTTTSESFPILSFSRLMGEGYLYHLLPQASTLTTSYCGEFIP